MKGVAADRFLVPFVSRKLPSGGQAPKRSFNKRSANICISRNNVLSLHTNMAKDTRKIIQALTYLANYQPDKMLDNMKAYKLLWLADRYHLRQTGRTITGDSYYAMPYGIVPSDAKCLLEKAKTKLKDPKGYIDKFLILSDHQYKAIAEPDLKEFSESDLDALNKVLAEYNGYDAIRLSSISHKFPEWLFYKDMLKNRDSKNSYKIDLDHFFEDAPNDERKLFNDSHELLELTQELYHQYNRV